MRVLLVEDEQALCNVIAKELVREGYVVDACGDGLDALDYIAVSEYDCIVLDVMLPGKDGLSVLREMRQAGNATPVLLLTALDSVNDRVNGLDSGADDYLVKPFSFDELFARIRALLRRNTENRDVVLRAADLELNTAAQTATRAGQTIELTSREYTLLEYLLRNKGLVLTRNQILDHVWSLDFDGDSNIVDVYIRYLRRKMDNNYSVKLIHTVRGSGYALREEE